MARRDGQYMQAYKGMIISVGGELGVEPAVIAGIISRETRGGTAISQTGGWGDHGNAFGLMQVRHFTDHSLYASYSILQFVCSETLLACIWIIQ